MISKFDGLKKCGTKEIITQEHACAHSVIPDKGLPSHTRHSCTALDQVLIVHQESYIGLTAFEQTHVKRSNLVIFLHIELSQQLFREIQSSGYHSLDILQLDWELDVSPKLRFVKIARAFNSNNM